MRHIWDREREDVDGMGQVEKKRESGERIWIGNCQAGGEKENSEVYQWTQSRQTWSWQRIARVNCYKKIQEAIAACKSTDEKI